MKTVILCVIAMCAVASAQTTFNYQQYLANLVREKQQQQQQQQANKVPDLGNRVDGDSPTCAKDGEYVSLALFPATIFIFNAGSVGFFVDHFIFIYPFAEQSVLIGSINIHFLNLFDISNFSVCSIHSAKCIGIAARKVV